MEETKSIETEEIDLRGPHSSFRYPPFAQLPKSLDDSDLESTLSALVYPLHPARVEIFSRLSHAVSTWLKKLQSLHTANPRALEILCFSPMDLELKSALFAQGARVRYLPEEPERWSEDSHFEGIDGAILSNPNQANGFFYPETLLSKLLLRLQESQCADILCDETLQLFSFSTLAPASIKFSMAKEAKLSLCASLYPTYSPAGPKISWLISSDDISKNLLQSPSTFPHASPEDYKFAIRALLSFNSRQGATVMEFQRRLLALRQGLRRFTDMLKDLRLQGFIHIPHWPEAGIYLSIELPQIKNQKAVAFCESLARERGLYLEGLDNDSGTIQLRLCFAAHERYLFEAARRLEKFLARYPTSVKP